MAHVRSELTAYLDKWPSDDPDVTALPALDDPAALCRHTMTGHFTASAIVRDPAGRVLLVHHRVHDKLLQPGGHLEASDESLSAAARREASEETGIDSADLVLVDKTPIWVDVHPIPANPRKGEGAHRHFDVQYLFHATATELTPCEEEVAAAEWRPLADLPRPMLAERIEASA